MNRMWRATLLLAPLAATACNAADSGAGNATARQADAAAAPASPAPIAASAPAAPAAPAEASRPAPNADYDWAMRINEEERTRPAILAYEMSNTDDQPLNFSCEEGGARIFAGINGGPHDLNALILVSGDQTLRLSGRTEQTELPEMPSFTSAGIDGRGPFIKAFAANGWLRMTADGHTTDMTAATPAGTKAIADFVAHCTRPHSPGR